MSDDYDGHWVVDPGGYVDHPSHDDNYEAVRLHHVNTVEHRPEYDNLHDRLHRGAVDLIYAYHHRPGFEYLVLNARRILQHDAHNATPELRDRYTADLVAALQWLAASEPSGDGC